MMRSAHRATSVVVAGQVARDLVLHVESVPEAGGSSSVSLRHELLGGKGANQAVAAAQLGAAVRLVGVVGSDHVAEEILRQAAGDGIDVRYVVHRDGPTALLVDVVDDQAQNRFLEHVPGEMLLRTSDVQGAAGAFDGAELAMVQLQQPADTCIAAANAAQAAGCFVVLDGAVPEVKRDVLMSSASLLRADAHEAELMLGHSISSETEAGAAARDLQRRGLDIVVFSVGAVANVVASGDGVLVAETLRVDVVDPTGGGDSFVVAFALAIARGDGCAQALREATAASSATVSRLGGRPELSLAEVQKVAETVRVSPLRFRPA